MTDVSDEAGGEEWSVLDENFVREASVKEPSARARMLTARWRKHPPQAQPWRGAQTTLFGQSLPGSDPFRVTWRRLARRLAVPVLASAVILAALWASTGPLGWRPPDSGLDPGLLGVPEESPSFPVDVGYRHPFADSPAEKYADGAAGIVPPPVTALPGYSKDKVAQALAQTKYLLIAANLDPKMLGGGSLGTFLALLDPQVAKDIGKDAARDPEVALGYVTRFAADSEFIGGTVKVKGTMSVKQVPARRDEDGHLSVRTDYLFVYAVRKVNASPQDWTRIVMRRIDEFRFYRSGTGGLDRAWPAEVWRDGPSGGRCDTYDGLVHPEWPTQPQLEATPTGPPEDPYDQSRTPTPVATYSCGSVSRL